MRPTTDLPPSAELVVIGGGVVGAATAFHAARAGLSPLLLEARDELCSLTTPVATGAFRLQFDNLEEIELVRESIALFLDFAQVTGQREHDPRARAQGYLFVTTDEAAVGRQRTLVERQHGWGLVDVELLDGDEVRRRFPYVGPAVLQGRYRPGDGFLDPRELTLGLAAGSGAPAVVGTRVTGFLVRGDRLVAVETSRGPVATERAVIACGPLTGPVAALAGVELPIETVPRHKLVFPEAPEVPPDAPMTIDDDTATHWRPFLAGAAVLCTDAATPAERPAERPEPDERFVTQVMDPASPQAAARVAPFWREVWERETPWVLQVGQYDMTPDHGPLIGQTGVEGLFVNAGYSGHGVMAGPAGSRILADLLTGRLSPADNPFPPGRPFEARPPDTL